MSERERALSILQRVRKDDAFAARLLEYEGDERDRRFVRNLVLGVLRWRGEIDFLIEKLADRRINKLDPSTVDILRLGVYEVLHTDAPPHAVVNEAVSLAAKRAARSRGLVNAVLRRATSTELRALLPAGHDAVSLAVSASHPRWLMERWIANFGEARAQEIAYANQELSFPDLFINGKRITIAQADEILRRKEVAFEPSPLLPGVVRLRGPVSQVADEIEQGLFHPMDEGSAVVATVVPSDTRTLLDLAAAPGGKSLVLAARGVDVVAHDLSLGRLLTLRSALSRMSGRSGRLVAGDGRMPPFRERFDSVLLDAPCSATGTIRKNPELKWRLKAEQIAGLSALQEELLDRALDLASRYCIYSTCSLEPEENDSVVERVLSRRGDFVLDDIGNSEGMSEGLKKYLSKGVLRLTPESGADGFTVHRLCHV